MSQSTVESSAPSMNMYEAWDFGRLARQMANWAACVLFCSDRLYYWSTALDSRGSCQR